ncbi:MAG: hypothetical protein IJV07_05815 [Alphaproteobacteria bacterium]|nr:hypothetical protein [Alphaproteobacteria bacterium]
MTQTDKNKLTPDEKKLLKAEIKKSWAEFPEEMKRFLIDVKKEKLKALYMIEGWAKDNGHETILNLIARKIAHKEAKIKELESDQSSG